MPVNSSSEPGGPGVPPHEPRWAWWLVALVVGASALALRLVPVVNGAGLSAFYRYDSGVYFAAAAGFSHGLMPYRDFLLLHPPGSVLALAPFAALGPVIGDRAAMMAARAAFMFMGALTSVLVSRTLRPLGWVAALAGGLAYAGYGPAVYVERSTGLEALGTFLTVAGVWLLARDRGAGWRRAVPAVVGGALLGLSVSAKIWGVVTVVAVLAWLLLERRFRAALMAAAGATAAIGAVYLPFFAAAPGQMWQMVVLDQLGRPASGRGVLERAYDLTGLVELRAEHWSAALLLALVLLAGCAVAAAFTDLGRLALIGVASGVVLLLSTPSWFRGYPGLVAGFVALMVGAAAAVVGRQSRGWLRWPALAVLAAGLVAAGSLQRIDDISEQFNGDALAQLAVNRGGCVTTDDPSALIASNLLTRNLDRRCPLVVDLSGYQYHLRGSGPVGVKNAAWQEFALDYFRDGDTMLLLRSTVRGWLSETSLAEIKTWPVIGRVSGANVREPSGG